MVVGFVNSGIMKLEQAVGVIMGANIGTTVTAQILRLSSISGGNAILDLLQPSVLGPVMAVIGIIFFMFIKGGVVAEEWMMAVTSAPRNTPLKTLSVSLGSS